MRHVPGLVVLMILASAIISAADETAIIDPASATGVRVVTEIDPVDPAWVRCTIEWLRPSERARVSVQGSASVALATVQGSDVDSADRWSSGPFRVEAGDQNEFVLELARGADSGPVMLIAERSDGPVSFQSGVMLRYDGGATTASHQTNLKVRNEDLGNGSGFLIAEHLGPMTATKAQVFVEDGTNHSIPDGPTDCSSGSTDWPLTTFISISSAPPAALGTAVTVHLTVNHPVMANLQIVFSKEFYTVARYLWRNGAGVNLNQDFTTDIYANTLPGVGETVNGTWVLALRDCNAGSTGVLDYWSVRIDYSAASTIDLVADSLSVDPNIVEAGDTVEVDWAGQVAGSGTVGGPFTVGFYLSNDTNITTGDVLLGQVVESAAQNPSDTFGQSSPGQILTIPGGTANGSYYLGMIIDTADAVGEANETNNVSWSGLTVAPAATIIDLVADSVGTTTSSVAAGGSFQVAYAGHATGSGTIAGNFSLGLYLSTDAQVTPIDTLLGERVGAWATTGGDSFGEAAYTVTVPPATPAGTYYLGFWIDNTGVVTESNESNNSALHHPLTVTGGGGGQPNLTAMPCSVTPILAQPGDQVALSWRAFNTGDAGSGAFSRGIYLSTGGAINPATDTLLRQDSEGNWAPGHDSGARLTNVTLSAGLTEGLYTIGLVLDNQNAVTESDEADNICTTQLQVGAAVAPTAVTRWLVPAAASAPGFGTSNWRSQVSVVNPLNTNRTANLYFVANGAPWPGVLLSGPVTISPTDSVYFNDVLATLNPASGLLYVVVDQVGPVVTSRTYNLEPGGATFGQGIPAIPFEGISPPDEVVLPMVHTSPGLFHTNLGIVHAAAGNLQVQVQVFNAYGALIGTKNYSHNAAWRQINDVFDDMGLGAQVIFGGWLRVTRTAGAGFWTCYASVVDDLTNDPTYVAPVELVRP